MIDFILTLLDVLTSAIVELAQIAFKVIGYVFSQLRRLITRDSVEDGENE